MEYYRLENCREKIKKITFTAKDLEKPGIQQQKRL